MVDFYDTTAGIRAQPSPASFAFLVTNSAVLLGLSTRPEPAKPVAYTTGASRDVYVWSESEQLEDGVTFLRPADRAGSRGRWVRAVGGYNLLTPKEILSLAGGTLHNWAEADAPNLVVASGGSTWPDLSGAGLHWTKANATGISVTEDAIDGLPAIDMNGTAGQGFMTSLVDCPAPGTTPSYFYTIMVQRSFTDTDAIVCATSAARMHVETRTVTPNIRLGSNGTSASSQNSNLTIGSWKRVAAGWNNATTDFILAGSVTVTGTAVGVNVGTGRTLGALTSGASGNIHGGFYAVVQYSAIAPANHGIVLALLDMYFKAKVPSVEF